MPAEGEELDLEAEENILAQKCISISSFKGNEKETQSFGNKGSKWIVEAFHLYATGKEKSLSAIFEMSHTRFDEGW